MGFYKDFIWGAASASAQVEGAFDEDGKCLSIWDVADGHIKNNDTCHVADDHYHRYKEDVALMKQMGLKAYRFSISWCRVMPEEGKINEKGLQFYRNLVDELKANDIEPMVTLYHWDLPLWIQKQGGWKNPKIVDWYLAYTKAVVEKLSDSVTYWMTFNEPTCFLMLGEMLGMHAPFEHHFFTIGKYMKQMLLAHGKAVKLIRETAKTPAKVGIVMAANVYVPENESEEALANARKITFESQTGVAANSQYMDPIVLKKPAGFVKGKLSKEDLDIISEPIDFIGINCYQPCNERMKDKNYGEHKHTMMNWVIDGRTLYWVTRFYHERYHLPILISENGMANPDVVADDGRVHDEIRRDFIKEYLTNLKRACDENIPVFGYLHWSIMDNFEWAEGYGPRFGLIHVDYKTQKRTIKDSAYYYKEIIESNGGNL